VANVGDSFAYLLTSDEVHDLTAEHSLSIASERDRIASMGVELYDGQTRVAGLKVTRALGDLFTKQIESGVIAEPHVSPVHRIKDDEATYLVIASDGVCF
jgi:serine/threonine protein phosphatase PrpC